jgi:hypothetical protein
VAKRGEASLLEDVALEVVKLKDVEPMTDGAADGGAAERLSV